MNVQSRYTFLASLLFAALFGAERGIAFMPRPSALSHKVGTWPTSFREPVLRSSEDDISTQTPSTDSNTDTTSSTSDVTSTQIDGEKPYPLEVPSPLLLSSSMFLAIVSTGSLFELIDKTDPALGFIPTAAIVTLGFPLAIFLFYASVLKAQAETEEDDKKFLGK